MVFRCISLILNILWGPGSDVSDVSDVSGEFINYLICILIFLFIYFKELNIKILVLSQLEIRTLHFVTYTKFK